MNRNMVSMGSAAAMAQNPPRLAMRQPLLLSYIDQVNDEDDENNHSDDTDYEQSRQLKKRRTKSHTWYYQSIVF
jgi:hypothetical protein